MKHIGFATSAEFAQLTSDDQRAAHELLRRGFKVTPVVWDRDVTHHLDALVFRSCWDYHLKTNEFHQFLERLSVERIPVWNALPTLKWNLNKTYLVELERKNILIPQTEWTKAGDEFDLAAWMKEHRLNECVVKPTVSMSGADTWCVKLTDIQTFMPTFDGLRSSRDLMIQEFLPHILSEGEISLLFFNGLYSHSVQKKARPGEFRIHEEHGGSREACDPPRQWILTAEKILSCVHDEWLYARVDLVHTEAGPSLMELEMIDPMLFLEFETNAAARFADALIQRL